MPFIPSTKTLEANTPNILNAIRSDLGGTFKDLVPVANNTNDSIQAVGQAIMENHTMQNTFLTALMNRIGLTIIKSKSYLNPWRQFKKGMLEFGETIEEIFVSMAEPYQFDPEDASETLFKRTIPDVSTAFHRLNFAKQYSQTVTQQELKQAFLNMSGITDLISKITESMYTGMEYDEFIVMKYLLARTILRGKTKVITIPTLDKANLSDIATTIKATSNQLTYMKKDYNMAHVPTHTMKTEQNLIVDSEFEAKIDVNLLAVSFHMDKVEFMGHMVGVDSLGDVDTDRLDLLFKDDPTYVPFTSAELALLNTLPCILLDEDFFMIFDNLLEMSDIYNPKGLYWNYFLNTWKTFSVSPFANCVAFTTSTPSVTSVTVAPVAISLNKGSRFNMKATVVATGFADTGVKWSITGNTANSPSTISPDGILSIGSGETATTLTVKATSIADSSKSDTATITILGNTTP